jgi:hypothetical protein
LRTPARNEAAALTRHTDVLQRSLQVVTKAIWTGDVDRGRMGPHSLRLSENPLRLPRADPGSIYLAASQRFEFERSGRFPGEWRVHTLQYIYSLGLGPRFDDAIVAWHYHPDLRKECHVHVYGEFDGFGPLRDLHIPSRRVSFEEVVRFAIVDLGVRASPNWERVLDESEALFDEYKTWGGARGRPKS